MMKILEQSGCDELPKMTGVLFDFLEHYLGIKCTVNDKTFKDLGPSKIGSSQSKPKKQHDIIQST